MRDESLSSYRLTKAKKLTKAREELTDEDNALLDKMCSTLLEKFE